MTISVNNKATNIHLNNLKLIYQNHVIFSNLTMTFYGGKINILLGCSGVGKSSLLKMIAGIMPYSEGSITTDNHISLPQSISYMAQQDLLMPWATIIDNVMIGSKLRGEKPDIVRAQHILDQVQLLKNSHQYPSQLSGGMRQRAALARTLYENRPIILMDEPFSALDSVTRNKMQEYTANLLKNKTVILITHDPFEACRIGEDIYILAGSPAILHKTPNILGVIPRLNTDDNVQRAQANLLQFLIEKTN